jgi:Ino eighty subunit 1
MLKSLLKDGGICDGATLSFAQLFCPHPVSSASRARAVLWNLFHYMEGSKVANPFADARDPYRPPPLLLADEEELEHGNRDTEEELEWCAVMKARRHQFMRTVQQEEKAAAALVEQMVNPPAEGKT